MPSKTYGYYTAGWCGSCGRKRGPDGRCPNCDPWWTSPLVQTGGPVVLCVTLFLFLGVSLLKRGGVGEGRAPSARPVATGYSPVLTAPAYHGGGAMPPLATGYPSPALPAAPAAPSLPPLTFSAANNGPSQAALEAARYQRHEQLRQMTAYADAYVQQVETARTEASRAAYAGSSPFAPSYSGRAGAEVRAEMARPMIAPSL